VPDDRPLSRWMANDNLFTEQLAAGHRWAEVVGDRLRRECGFPVSVTPMTVRASVEDIPRYADDIDIRVGHDDAPQVVIESKSRALTFTEDPASFPYRTALVDTRSGWDAKETPPAAVVLVSQQTSAMLVISVRRTRRLWTTKYAYDRVRDIYDHWYEVPREALVPMQTLVDWLASGQWLHNEDPPPGRST
jgi:hypothetical protein